MENKSHNALPNTVADYQPIVDFTEGVKDSKFHTFLKEQFGAKAEPFIEWTKNTEFAEQITPRDLKKLVLLYEGDVNFNLAATTVALNEEVKKELLNIFVDKKFTPKVSIESATTSVNKEAILDVVDTIKDEKFHVLLKEQFGEKSKPFINWAKTTKLADKISQRKVEKLVLLYEGDVGFDLASKAVSLDPEVKAEIAAIFENKNTNVMQEEKVVDVAEGIKNGQFHIVLKEQFGEKADPFINWAKNTKLEDKITQGKLEKLVLLYEGQVEFDLVAKALSLEPEIKNEIFNIFEDQKMNEKVTQIIMNQSNNTTLGNRPKM